MDVTKSVAPQHGWACRGLAAGARSFRFNMAHRETGDARSSTYLPMRIGAVLDG